MGFLDFFKKIKKKPVEEVQAVKVSLNKVKGLIQDIKNKNQTKEEEVLDLVGKTVREFIKDINDKLEILEDIDVDSKKAEDKFKDIVKKNLNNYIRQVRETLDKVNKVRSEKLVQTMNAIDKIFFDFNKNSNLSYHKATILIGKEMAQTRERMKEFSNKLINILKENQALINNSKAISSIEIILKQVDENDEILNRINKKIKDFDSKIIENNETRKRMETEIGLIEKSQEHLENQEKLEKINLDKKELGMEIFNLKSRVDFKKLSNIHHVSEKEMKIIKAHKEDFQTEINKDNGENLLRLYKEANLNSEPIKVKLKEIINKKEKIEDSEKAVMKNETEELLTKIKNLKSENINIDSENNKAIKKLEKIENNRELIINSLKNRLFEINVVLEE